MADGTLLITMCVVTILVGFGVMIYAVWCECYRESVFTRYKINMMVTLGLLLVIVGMAMGVCWKQYNAFYNAVDSGYVIYINGQEVEPEHINLNECWLQATVDNDNQVILVSLR